MKRTIKELLSDLDIVNARLNNTQFNHKSVELNITYIRAKQMIQAELNLYSKEEIEEARKPSQKIARKVQVIEEVEIKRTEERGLIYWFLLVAILQSKEENKAFLLIGLELFGKEEKIEKIYHQKIIG